MGKKPSRTALRQRRHRRVRKRLAGRPDSPRLNVFRSLHHIYAQVINDEEGRTLVSASTLDKDVRQEIGDLSPTEQAKRVGLEVARRAKAQGIETVVFDRGGYKYHGRVKALAEGARKGGLQF